MPLVPWAFSRSLHAAWRSLDSVRCCAIVSPTHATGIDFRPYRHYLAIDPFVRLVHRKPLMKIAVFANDFPPRQGGIAALSRSVCQGLHNLGHQVLVVTERAGDVTTDAFDFEVLRLLEPLPQKHILLQGLLLSRWRKSNCAKLVRAIQGRQVDCILCTNLKTHFDSVFEKAGLPYFLFIHGDDIAAVLTRRKGRSFRSVQRTIANSKAAFFNSNYSRQIVQNQIPAIRGRAHVTGCGVPLDHLEEVGSRVESRDWLGWGAEPVLLTVCRQHHRKGVDLVIKALAQIRRHHPICRFVVAGDGPDLERFRNEALRLGQVDHVSFLGQVDELTKMHLYRAADLFVMPSRAGSAGEMEGFGISFLEANACGLAVVGTDLGGIPDAVEHRVNGMLVPPEDVTALAQTTTELLNRPDIRDELAAAGRHRIRTRFNWPSICDSINEKITQSLQANRVRSDSELVTESR